MKPLAIITGVGPGTGSAIVRRFHAGGYRVAMLARSHDRLADLVREMPNTIAVPCDVADPIALDAALRGIGSVPRAIVHNAVGGAFGTFMEIEPEVLDRNFRVNVMALLHLARWAAPKMAEAGGGALIVTGNTSAIRGKAKFAGFAPTKAAQRILAESIARELGPKGVHVSYVMIDAIIDLAWTRERFPDRADDAFIQPADIANEIWHIAHQPRSAWSFLSEIRPYCELW